MKINVDAAKIKEVEDKIEEYAHSYEIKIQENEIEYYVTSLEHTEKSLRRSSLEEYIKAKLESEAADWKRRFDGYIKRLTQMKENLSNSVDKLSKYISTKENTIADLFYKKSEKENQLQKIEQDIINTGSSHHKISIAIMLTFALGLAFVSGKEFYDVKVAMSDMSEDSISIVSSILYTLGSLAFLAGGKILSIIYEKSGRNEKLFYGIAISAVIVTVMGIFSLAYSMQLQTELSHITQKIEATTQDGPAGAADNADEASDEVTVDYDTLQENKQNELESMKFYFIILTLMSELLIGAVAWMILIDYNHTSSKEQMEKMKTKLDTEIAKLEEKISKEEQDVNYVEYQERLSEYNNYINEIEQIIAQYDNFDEHNIIEKSFNANLQEGLKLLQKYNINVG